MGTRALRFALLGMSLVCGLALYSRPVSAAPYDAKTKALIARDDEWSKVGASRNADLVAAFYAEDAVAFPPNEPVAVGRAAAGEVWARYFVDPSYNLSWKTTSAGVEGATGWTAGTYEESFNSPDGKLLHGTGKYVCVWHKRANGKWMAIRDIWNSDTK